MSIICIEGGDACGKATQSKILAERLGAALFSFPDYSMPAGELILGNLKGQWRAGVISTHGDKQNAMVLQSLMLTNRMERGDELRAAAARGRVVLDRYDASGMVYGALDGLDPEWVRATNAQLPVRPDAYVLLDAPVEEGFRRRPERRDRYERDREYLERVRVAYLSLFLAEQEKAVVRARGDGKTRSTYVTGPTWRVVDAVGTVDEVAARVWQAVGL